MTSKVRVLLPPPAFAREASKAAAPERHAGFACSQMDSPGGAGLSQKRKADHVSIFQAWLTTESIRFRTRALKALLRDQRAEFGVIRRHLRPGDIACDIGANKGCFIYWLSWWVRNGRVIAFEPQPELAHGLRNICRVIKLGNVKVEA